MLELSLLRLAPRAATVSAIVRTDPSKPKLKVAALDAQAFTRLLGPLREIMERKAGEAYGPRYSNRCDNSPCTSDTSLTLASAAGELPLCARFSLVFSHFALSHVEGRESV